MSRPHVRSLLFTSFVLIIVACFLPGRTTAAQQARRTAPAPPKARSVWESPAATYSPAKISTQPLAQPPRPQTQVKFSYPDPKKIAVPQRVTHGHAPNPVQTDRYAKISEAEVVCRAHQDGPCGRCKECMEGKPCPLCEVDPRTPCGHCNMCKAGFPCEKTLCRHCVQQRSMNMGNSCDLSGGDAPCGTCDACREHRSDPCGHADDGYGPRGEFNPYKEPRILSALPRPIVDLTNNGARKFPVYYNPAPYYRPHWNPSTFAGYNRPFTFRWSCELCHKDPCECNRPGYAGQVSYAYSCKFCNRNPCACTAEICNVTKPLDPAGIAKSLAAMREESTSPQAAAEVREAAKATTREKGLLDEEIPVDLEK